MASELSRLLGLISNSVAILEHACEEAGASLPDLDTTYTPQSDSFHAHPEASKAVNTIVAAASQLCAIVRPAPTSLWQTVGSFHVSSAMRICLESNTVEILREAGPHGMHINDIAAINGLDPKKLVRCLRILATHHIFKEIKPDTFVNNRLSSTLDTGKPVSDLIAKPEFKHEGTSGFSAVLSHSLDEGFKGAAFAYEALSDPATAFSEEDEDAPLCRAWGTKLSMWNWMELPEQAHRLRRFGVAMRGVQALERPDAVLQGFDWKSLTEKDVVVDVAGGIGSASLSIAKAAPQVEIIIQDRPTVVADGLKVWEERFPEAIHTGRVRFEARDLFAPQPVKNASVFFLRRIMHDWSDKYASKILTELREAAMPTTKLIISDGRMLHACHDPSEEGKDPIPGSGVEEAPPPLLANYGAANVMSYIFDLQMMFNHNAQERTLVHLTQLLRDNGWRVTRVYQDPLSATVTQTEAVPI